jgi:hypothetical protein
MYGRLRELARYLATVLLPHPAGPVTNQMWWSSGECRMLARAAWVDLPLVDPWSGSWRTLGDDGTDWRADEMLVGDDGQGASMATGMS